MDYYRKQLRQSGFTLVEVLVVIAILAILLIIGIGALLNQRYRAQDTDAKSKLVLSYNSAWAQTISDETFPVGNNLLNALASSEPGIDFELGPGINSTRPDQIQITQSRLDHVVLVNASASGKYYGATGSIHNNPSVDSLSGRIAMAEPVAWLQFDVVDRPAPNYGNHPVEFTPVNIAQSSFDPIKGAVRGNSAFFPNSNSRYHASGFPQLPTGQVSIEIVFRKRQAGLGVTGYIFDNIGTTQNGFALYLLNDTTPVFTTCPSPSCTTWILGPTINDTAWHHLIAVRDNSGYRIYIDGALFTSSSIASIPAASAQPYTFGNRAGIPNSNFRGDLYAAAVYHRGLSHEEALAHGRAFNEG